MVKVVDRMVEDVRTDYTWNRVGRLTKKGAAKAPTAAAHYALDKFPIIGWLPRYNPRWIVNDVIAGLTIGLMLIPQALSYAKIATIPVEYGLMSSWLPPAIYTFMGSTKGAVPPNGTNVPNTSADSPCRSFNWSNFTVRSYDF